MAHPREQAKDAEAFSLLTEFGCKRAQKMVAGNKVGLRPAVVGNSDRAAGGMTTPAYRQAERHSSSTLQAESPRWGRICFVLRLQRCTCGHGLGPVGSAHAARQSDKHLACPLQAKSGQDLLRALRHKFGSADNDDLENDPDAFSWDRLSQAVKGFFFTAPGAQQGCSMHMTDLLMMEPRQY